MKKFWVDQIVSSAGDGNLRDGTAASEEFRKFLRVVPSENLSRYARQCLEKSYEKGGLILQDIVNEFGQKLDFDVEPGLYQGKKTAIGFDGIWRSERDPEIIVEVKTTDYVTVSLDKLAGYREKLNADHRIGSNASIPIVVGRGGHRCFGSTGSWVSICLGYAAYQH